MRRISILSTLLLTLAPSAAAQGGFPAGELVVYNPSLKGPGAGSGGVARVDPLSGQVQTLTLLPGGSLSFQGVLCYDAFRGGVVFSGTLAGGDPLRLWLSDSAGNLTDLGLQNTVLSSLTPGAGGRIYARGPTSATPIVYLDAANQLHTLMDASGTQPWQPPAWDSRGMLYHAGWNALFIGMYAGSPMSCGSGGDASLHRLRLSEDGTRALGIDACASFVVDPGGINVPTGIALRPDGKLLVTITTNVNGQLPRMQLVDPDTLAVTPFAANGPYLGDTVAQGGTWSHLLGKAVMFDTFNNVLRAYAQNQSGDGALIVPSETISADGVSGETTTLLEVPAQPCAGTIGTYCTAKTTSNGCLPALSSVGCPSASAGSGFVVRATQVHPGNLGLFLYGTHGPNAAPVLGGTLCVGAPILRTPASFALGSGACGGQYAFDFNAWVPVSNDPELVPGAVVHGQFWFRDPPASFGTGLTGGITFTLAP